MDIIEKAKNYKSENMANMPTLEATITDVDIKGFSLSKLTLFAKVPISNPYFIPIAIGEITYFLKSAGRGIASGTILDPGSLKAIDKMMLEVTVKLSHSAVVSLIRDIGNDWDIDCILEL
ncbi:desiccation protectant protein lea14 homolog [Phtheirospermum japonicum]|uniref:Desiccation protectant protein lea14 homolog n=1 Tax=Phtheirospermum japonicum TaxID=374723 RepID=A0A830BG33_9LAMI|nr:desiccation protectant protein lea14 homolog [Phtheirospermum japonicum]